MSDTRGELVTVPLQNVSLQYVNDAYKANEVAPLIDNVPIDAKITKYNKGDFFRLIDGDIIRYPGDEAKRGDFKISYTSIHTIPYAFAKEVRDEDRRNAAYMNTPPLQPDIKAIKFATNQVDLQKEYRVAALIQATTWSSANEDAAGGWTAATGSTFEADVWGAINTMKAATGLDHTKLRMIMDFKTWTVIKQDLDLANKYKYVHKGSAPDDIFAAIFGIGKVLVSGAMYSTADEAADGTDWSQTYIWESNATKGGCFVYYYPEEIGLDMLAPVGQFRVKNQGDENGRKVYTFREAGKHQDVYEVSEEMDEVAIAADLGYLFTDTHTT